MAYTRIDVAKARELIDKSHAAVIDVRDPASYEAGHIPGAEAVNDSNVQAFVQAADRSRPLIVCCYHGNMSQGAADYFHQHGFAETYSLDGGYEAWQAAAVGDAPPEG
ncbi:MAG: thiosulfate sulfurtransferase GlpE [Acidobacteria bacterium]|nr:thiosulfate sulfurtransferase GlpE [Acidobacteriota bacterium]